MFVITFEITSITHASTVWIPTKRVALFSGNAWGQHLSEAPAMLLWWYFVLRRRGRDDDRNLHQRRISAGRRESGHRMFVWLNKQDLKVHIFGFALTCMTWSCAFFDFFLSSAFHFFTWHDIFSVTHSNDVMPRCPGDAQHKSVPVSCEIHVKLSKAESRSEKGCIGRTFTISTEDTFLTCCVGPV